MQSRRSFIVQRRAVAIVSLVTWFTLASCNAMRTTCPACPSGTSLAPVKICSAEPDEIREEMAATVFNPSTSSNTDAPEMLFMSAGGSWGAFGAGVLYAWAEAGTRPQFEVVTGSSTGALLGVFAILGAPCTAGVSCVTQIDEDMKAVYTTSTNADIFTPRSFLALPFGNSINTLEPLRALVKKTFTPTIVQQVGQIYTTTGRQLWVGTTDLDSGQFCNWNLSRIAADGDYQRFVDLLIASSANPGVFDPVIIDGALHADGGVRHQLYGAWVEGAVAAYDDARSGKPPIADHPVAYAIVNGQMAVRRQCVTNHIAPVVLRSSQILMNDALVGDLYQAKARLAAGSPPWDLLTTRVPSTYKLWPSPDHFVPANMLDLFQQGRAIGGDLGKWTVGVPNAGVPETECLPMF
jgi:hypothetical protein